MQHGGSILTPSRKKTSKQLKIEVGQNGAKCNMVFGRTTKIHFGAQLAFTSSSPPILAGLFSLVRTAKRLCLARRTNPSRSPSTAWLLEIVFAIPQRLATIAGICGCHGHVHNVHVCRVRRCVPSCGTLLQLECPSNHTKTPRLELPSIRSELSLANAVESIFSSNEWSRHCPSANNVINCNFLAALFSSVETRNSPAR